MRRLASRGLAALMLCAATFAAPAQDLPLDAAKSSVTFVGEAFLHNFHGEARDLSGQATLDPKAVPPVQKARLNFKAAALTTFNAGRDQKMYEWLQVAESTYDNYMMIQQRKKTI